MTEDGSMVEDESESSSSESDSGKRVFDFNPEQEEKYFLFKQYFQPLLGTHSNIEINSGSSYESSNESQSDSESESETESNSEDSTDSGSESETESETI